MGTEKTPICEKCIVLRTYILNIHFGYLEAFLLISLIVQYLLVFIYDQ